jgi:Zinc knuckle
MDINTVLFESPSEASDDQIIGRGVAQGNAGASDGGGNSDPPLTAVSVGLPTTPSKKYNMPKPIMGDIVYLDDENSIVWVGGKPLIDWQGLNPSTKPIPTPTMHRDIRSRDVKSYSYRIKGLSTKFGLKDDLRAFCRKVFGHFKQYGMDTITYVPDPANPNTMESVVEKPNLFTKEYVVSQLEHYVDKYDSYDRLNIRSATDFLLASLSNELERKVTEALMSTPNPSFLQVWMTLVERIRTLSVDRFHQLQGKVERRKSTDYPGENLEAMADDNLRDILDLLQGGWFSTNTGYTMVRNFAHANSECPEYRQFAYDLLTRYKDAVDKCMHMRQEESAIYMDKQGFGFEEICIKFSNYYRRATQDGYWLPHKNVCDSKGTPNQFANKAQTRRVNNIVQNSPQKPPTPSGMCHNCGEPGHWAKNCPLKNKMVRAPTSKVSQQKGTTTSWNRTPPPSGSPQTKQMHGKTFHWCDHCKRWTTTHGTSEHRSKAEANVATTNTDTKLIQLSATHQFSAWTCCKEVAGPKGKVSLVGDILKAMWTHILFPICMSMVLTLSVFTQYSLGLLHSSISLAMESWHH